MEERGKDRDKPDGERSMARCVAAFNAMTGHKLDEEDGWLFMVYLKHSRMRAGQFRQDDYEDAVAYEALMAESAVAPTGGESDPSQWLITEVTKHADPPGVEYPSVKEPVDHSKRPDLEFTYPDDQYPWAR